MYVIRLQLVARSEALPTPAEPAVRDGLERALRWPARLSHVRIRTTPGRVDAVAFVTADGLLAAERALLAAAHRLTAPGGPLAGWCPVHCEADSWLALGLHELPSRP